jgi:HPr kinase/phosphorylase
LPGAHDRLHATAIAFGDKGVLLRGPSGSGKSDLALRCLALAPSELFSDPVQLVADDQVIVERTETDAIAATAPPTLKGLLEVRGVGLVTVVPRNTTDICLVVDLVSDGPIERLPDPWPKVAILGVEIALLRLRPFEASAPQKLAFALRMAPTPRVISKA